MSIKSKLNKRLFNFASKAIFDTKPIVCDPASDVIVLSQTYHPDLTMYLVAAKSFARFVKPKFFVVIDDGLTNQDRETIFNHLGCVKFINRQDVSLDSVPLGGTWERLISAVSFSEDHFVIQVDSDTVTVSDPKEVRTSITENRSFTLSTYQGREVVSVKDASAFAKSIDGTHVQIRAERALDSLPNANVRRYVRGCSGFTGFARKQVRRQDLQDFSKFMISQLGIEAWSEWGSEQVTSNYLISNTQNPLMLPIEHYPYWSPGTNLKEARLIHFIGDHRFKDFEYIRRARTAINQLK